MKKIIVLSFFFTLVYISGCMVTPKRTLPPVTKETVKEVEAKAADVSQREGLQFQELPGYYLKTGVKLESEMNFIIGDSEKKFGELLGVKKSMAGLLEYPDLKKNLVAVFATRPSINAVDIKIVEAYSVGSDIYIDYELAPKEDPEVGYFINNMKAFIVERPKQVTNVSFVDPAKKMTIIPFGKRSAGSPSSADIMLKYYTGTYRGTIPAADGPGIIMILTLAPDFTFNLQQTYLSHPDRTFESSGNWAPTEDLSSFVINYDKDKNDRMRFYFNDKNQIEMLDQDGEKIDSNNYKLKK